MSASAAATCSSLAAPSLSPPGLVGASCPSPKPAPVSSPASPASPHSNLSSAMATCCAAMTFFCWLHMSCTTDSICMAPSKRLNIFRICLSRRSPIASRLPILVCSWRLRAWRRRSSPSASSDVPPCSAALRPSAHACWSSATSRCIWTKRRPSRPSNATTPSLTSTVPASASAMVFSPPSLTSPPCATAASRKLRTRCSVSKLAMCTSGAESGKAATRTCSVNASFSAIPGLSAVPGLPGPGIASPRALAADAQRAQLHARTGPLEA
mmetsp:Transcript_6406/g.13107  ORF Transcript_6406/g.13107 Transcript_6406/m.13107 type:complete len:268 (-) Transcript_6406:3-806(-)